MNKNVTQNFEIPDKIIRTGKLLQFFSTKLAAKFALKVFLSPPKFPAPEREQMMEKSVKAIPMLVPSIKREIMVYEYGFSKTRILLTHAWGGRGTQLYEIADTLLENGMMVITYDAPAHGKSEGSTTHLLENVACIEEITKKFGPFHAGIGHSFGGISLLVAQAKNPFLSALVTLGIAGYTGEIVDEIITKLKLKPKVSREVKVNIEAFQPGGLNDTSAAVVAKNVKIPTLILHDTEDYDVDVSNAYKIRQNLEQGSIVITTGLGHRKITRDQDTIQTLIKFIKN